jgi:SET domain-containing protein
MSNRNETNNVSNFVPIPKVYLKKSLIPGAGLGVFAASAFKKGDTVEIAPFIEIDHDYSPKNRLNDYVFSSHLDPNKVLVVFGYGSMYNHSPNNNVDYYRHSLEKERLLDYIAIKDIEKDQELYINYGENHAVNKIKRSSTKKHRKSKKIN